MVYFSGLRYALSIIRKTKSSLLLG